MSGLDGSFLPVPLLSLDERDAADRLGRLAHDLFAYLISIQSVFAPDYLRFRLWRPGDAAIVWRHDLDNAVGTVEMTIRRAIDCVASPYETRLT